MKPQTKQAQSESTASRGFSVTRTFDAPRDLVWEAWTNPKHIVHWWGPIGFTATIHEIDVRPGGVWRFVMHGPDGRDYRNKIVFDTVAKPELLEYHHSGEGEDVRFQVAVTFVAQGTQTQVTMKAIFESAAEFERVAKKYGAIEGAHQTMDRLVEHVARMAAGTAPEVQPVYLMRAFDAPREVVFDAFTKAEHLERWWGPKGFTMVSCKVDARPGGIFHYCMRGPDGREMWGKITYREVVRPERLVLVVSFSDAGGNVTRHPLAPDWPREVISTSTLTEQDGKTTLLMRAEPWNATDAERKAFDAGRDSMRKGTAMSWDQLAEYLAKR